MELEDQVMAEEAGKWWWVFLLTGVVWLMLGFVVLRLDVTSIATVGFLMGGMFVIAAVNEAMLASASNGGWKFLHWAMAVLFVFGSVWAFLSPGEATFALASVLGFILFFQGTFTIMISIASKAENSLWGLGLAAGILELLLAFWVSQRFIPARVTLILVWVGFMCLFRGVEHIVLAFSVRKVGKEMAAA
ncbi:MAG TPA: DUF308 domain-containing protein [Actinomycetota bacterium]